MTIEKIFSVITKFKSDSPKNSVFSKQVNSCLSNEDNEKQVTYSNYLDVPTYLRQGIKPNTGVFGEKAIC